MNSLTLDERQIWFLDDLFTFMLENYDLTNTDYVLFKNKIEDWQQYGFWDDAMLKFWYYEPIESLHSKTIDNYLIFCKVINNLGFYLPTDEQVVIINTLKLLKEIEIAETIHDKHDKIGDLWEAYEHGEAYDCTHIITAFNIVREKGFFEYNCNLGLFNTLYQRLVKLFELWKAKSPTKEQIYLSLIQ